MNPAAENIQAHPSPSDLRRELVAEARRFLDGDVQAGNENIHPEWQRLLTGIATHIVHDDLDAFTRWRAINHTMFIGDYGDTPWQLAALQARVLLEGGQSGAAWHGKLEPREVGRRGGSFPARSE